MRRNTLLRSTMVVAGLVTAALSLTAPPTAMAQVACDWTGVWLTTVEPSAGELTLTQTGTAVTGRYPEPLGGGTITAKATDGNGVAKEQGEYPAGTWNSPGAKTSGGVRFRMAKGCKAFTGEWNVLVNVNTPTAIDPVPQQFPRAWGGTRK